MNNSEGSKISLNSAQKFAAGLFILLFAGWFAQKIEWKATNTAQVLYFILLAAFFLLLIFLDPKVWKQLSNKGFFFALLAVWLALFQFLGNSILGYVHTSSLFSWMYDGYNSPNPVNDSSFCDLIPFLVLGLFWWKRNELVAQPKTKSWPGFVLLILAIGLHLFGYVLQQPRCSVVALFTGIYGLMGLVWGFEWLKKSFFPFFLFIFSGPLDIVIQPITFWLRYFVSALTEWVAHYIFGIGVMRQGTQLFDPSGSYGYDVAAACSGIRSLVAIFLLATIYAFIAFRAPWKRIFLMALAVPFAVLGNLLRMLLIIIAAALGGQDWGNYVHEGCPIHVPRVGDIAIVNLLPYVPAIIGLLWIGRWLEKMPDAQAKEPS